MQNTHNNLFFILILSQAIFSIALRSDVVIYKLSSFERQYYGITKTINLNNSTSLLDVSVFGWIKVIYSDFSKEILELKAGTNNLSYSENPSKDLIFYLQYLNWGTSKLRCGSFTHNIEDHSYFDLSDEEQNQWMFVYLGHSFSKLKQTYFLKSYFNQQILTKPVGEIENLQFCLISVGVGSFLGREFMNGKIERLTVLTGQGAYKESDFGALHSFYPDTVTKCAVGFDQCGYIGQYVELCEGQKKPKSVLLQSMDTVMICVNRREIQVKKDIDCINDGDLTSLYITNAIDFSDNPNNSCKKQ